MATITKRGPRQWQAKIRKKGYKSVSKTFSTKARAQRWATSVESDMERRVFIDSSLADETQFATVADRYFLEVLSRQKSLPEAKYRVRQLKAEFGMLALPAITPAVLCSYRDARLKVVSSASVRKELLLLRRIIETARKEWGFFLAKGNPVASIRIPADSGRRTRRLERDEERQLFDAVQTYGGDIGDLIALAIETAARRSELVGLRWEDIDLKNRKASLKETKNGESREVPLSSRARKVLKQRPRGISGRVFDISPHSVSQAFRRVCIRAELKNLRFHDLRHEATSRLFEAGLSIMEVAAITGHRYLAMLRSYTHLRTEDLARKLG